MVTQDHQETPRTAAHELHAHLTLCSGGLSPDYTCAIPVHVCEPETARQVTELRALREQVKELVVAGGPPLVLGGRILALLDALLSAGDKAEAPLIDDGLHPALPTLAGDKAETPR